MPGGSDTHRQPVTAAWSSPHTGTFDPGDAIGTDRRWHRVDRVPVIAMASFPAGERLVRDAYEAFGRRDLEALRAVLAEDAVWHQSGNNRISGDYCGRDAIVDDFMQRLMKYSDGTFQVETHDLLTSRDHVAVLQRTRARRGDRVLDGRLITVFRVLGGRVVEAWAVTFDDNEFWSYPGLPGAAPPRGRDSTVPRRRADDWAAGHARSRDGRRPSRDLRH